MSRPSAGPTRRQTTARAALAAAVLAGLLNQAGPAAAAEGPIWSAVETGPVEADRADVTAVDPVTGAVHVLGTTSTRQGATAALVTYNGDGTKVRTRLYSPPDATSATVAGIGLVVLPDGRTVELLSVYDQINRRATPILRAHDRRGALLWETQLTGPAGRSTRPVELTADAARGLLYLTATANRPGEERYSVTTAAFGLDGQPRWARDYRGDGEGGGGGAYAIDLTVDQGTGTVYVTADLPYVGKAAVVSYASDGTTRWSSLLSDVDDPIGLAVDDRRHQVYVTGYCHSFDADDEFSTYAMASDGRLLWTHREPAPSISNPVGDIVIEPGTGELTAFFGLGLDNEVIDGAVLLQGYTPDGQPTNRSVFPGTRGYSFGDRLRAEYDVARSVTVLAMQMYDFNSGGYIALLSYDSTGSVIGEERIDEGVDIALSDLAVDRATGRAVVISTLRPTFSSSNEDWLTLAYPPA